MVTELSDEPGRPNEDFLPFWLHSLTTMSLSHSVVRTMNPFTPSRRSASGFVARFVAIAALAILQLVAQPAIAQDAPKPLPDIAEKTAGMTKKDGFVPIYWDDENARVYLEINNIDKDFLYLTSLPAGLGSNDIGLDRGLLGGEKLVRFERVGRRVYIVQPNLRYRAVSQSAMERRSVEDAFASSIMWGFDISAKTGDQLLVDATDFVVRDAMDVADRLKRSGQGSFSLDKDRSMPWASGIKAFPDNTELEARVTYKGSEPGGYVRSVAADAEAVTLRIRQSLIRLPDNKYTPRKFDSRGGFGSTSFVDFAIPIGEEKEVRYINRHRLEKTDPSKASSPVVEPIVYYLDPGTPEPVRSALLEGGQWWADAFAAAGFQNAYRVEMLPDGADMLDVRYNVIQWVHRSTRGWSYGNSVADPRTGEIIKGHVSLGSLRVRQDYLIAEGLLAPYVNGNVPDDDKMLQMSLARIRQLSAHEIGHTLGISHNFAASVGGRASVMDYPAPLATVTPNGDVSLSDAYDTGIGEWDKVTIAFGYSQFASGTDEKAALENILQDSRSAGLQYITDTDARGLGGAHPDAHLWDNGTDPIASLENEMDVRQVALSRFTADVIRDGRPMATIEEALVPLYLRHRFQIEAVAKIIAGLKYEYSLRGSEASPPEPVPGDRQREAVRALLKTVEPSVLVIPASIAEMIPPRPPGYGGSNELFSGQTGLTFDAYAPAGVAADMVFDALTHSQRLTRLNYQSLSNPKLPSLNDVLEMTSDAVVRTKLPASGAGSPEAEVQRIVQTTWINTLMRRVADQRMQPTVRAIVANHLSTLQHWLETNPGTAVRTVAHRAFLESEIERFLFRPFQESEMPGRPSVPAGSPIGSGR